MVICDFGLSNEEYEKLIKDIKPASLTEVELIEENFQLTQENEKLREQLKTAVKQGMDGTKAGYEEMVERQKGRIKSLEEVLDDVIRLVPDEYSGSERVEVAMKVLLADWR